MAVEMDRMRHYRVVDQLDLIFAWKIGEVGA
jgi:hypothetical protein